MHIFKKSKKEAEEHFKQSIEHSEKGNFTESIALLEKAVKKDSTFARAWAHLALNLAKARRYSDMEESVNRIVALEPEDAEIWNTLGEAMMNWPGSHDFAAECFNISLSIEKTATGWKGLGDALLKMGKMDLVAESYAKWCVIDPENPVAWFRRGQALNYIKRSNKAILAFRSAVRLDNSYAAAYCELAESYNKLSRYDEALAICKDWVQLKPGSFRAWSFIAKVLSKVGRFKSSIACYEKAISIKNDNWPVWNDFAELHFSIAQYEVCIDVLDRSRAFVKNSDMWGLKGRTQMMLGRYQDAIDSFDMLVSKIIEFPVVESYPEDLQAYMVRANVVLCLTNMNKFDEALALEKYLEQEGEEVNKDRHNVLISCIAHRLCCQGEIDCAFEKVDEYISNSENVKHASQVLLFVADFQKDINANLVALKFIDKYLETTGQTVDVRLEKVAILKAARKTDLAKEDVLAMIDEDDKNAKVHFELATILAIEEKNSEALESLSKALELNGHLSEFAQLESSFGKLKEDTRFLEMVSDLAKNPFGEYL